MARSKLKLAARSTAIGPKVALTAKPAVIEPVELSGGRFATAFLDDRGNIAVDRLTQRLGLSKAQLAETTGLTQDVLYRSARLERPKPQARLNEMVEIVGRIAGWAGGEKQALAWYRAEPLPSFGGRTAESLVKDGKAAAVRDFLDRVATGGFA
jgi:hypothetical protein